MSGTTAASIACVEVVELVTDYLDGALPDSLRARIDAHLAACRGCTAYLEQIRTTVRVTGRVGADDVPTELRDRLLAAFRSWRSDR